MANDLVKYFTQELVRYFDTPKQDRKRKPKEKFMYRWFGFIPLSIRMMFKKKS